MTFTIQVTFGDCDPAGIVFYPNTFRWMDAAFHNHLRPHGGHKKLCEELQAVGLGLVDSSAKFKRPMRDGDMLSIEITIEKWDRKTLTIAYDGRVDGVQVFQGREIRCLFIQGKTGINAGDLTELRKRLERN